MSESIEDINKSSNFLVPNFSSHCILLDLAFNGQYLINNNISIPKQVIDLYISIILNPGLKNLNTDSALNNLLLVSVEVAKNADPEKCKYSAYATGLIIEKLFILILRIKKSYFLVKDQHKE